MGTTGLRNIGNSCYINTTLQALSSVKPFTQGIINRTKTGRDQESGKLTDELGSLVQELKSGEYKYITPEDMSRCIKQKSEGRFANGRQEDAHELLVFLLDLIHEETKKEKEGSVIENTFSGKMETTLTCTR